MILFLLINGIKLFKTDNMHFFGSNLNKDQYSILLLIPAFDLFM